MPPPSAEGGSVRSASFYSRILCKRLHANIILHTNTVGARFARPFRNECNFCFVTGRRGRRPLQQYAIKTVTIRLHANNILLLNTVGEHSICSRNTKRADMESAPTANNVILMHTVGARFAHPFQNKCYFTPKRTANGRPYIKKFMQTP